MAVGWEDIVPELVTQVELLPPEIVQPEIEEVTLAQDRHSDCDG